MAHRHRSRRAALRTVAIWTLAISPATACASAPAPEASGSSSAAEHPAPPATSLAPPTDLSPPPTTTSPPRTSVDASTPVAGVREVLSAALGRLLVASGARGGIAAYRHGTDDPVVTTAGAIDDADDPMTTERPFPIASVTKSFTAALLVDLADDGLVDLDAPISSWIDWPEGDRITLRQLLTHTSGLGAWAPSTPDGAFDAALFSDLAANHALADVVEYALAVPPVGAPGDQTSYSNLNYVLAGRIAELAGGAPYARLLADRITDPLGLAATTYPTGDQPSVGAEPLPGTFEYPEGVVVRTTDYPQSGFLSLMGPSAAAMSTVSDLLAWSDALFRARRVGDTDLTPLLQLTPGGTGLGVLGVDEFAGTCAFTRCPDDAEFEYLGLNGEAPGAAVRLWYEPATDTTLLIYLNRDGTSLDQPIIDLFHRLESMD